VAASSFKNKIPFDFLVSLPTLNSQLVLLPVRFDV
jgi:hypothetical protein